jgi:phage replication O-like protein O
MLDKSLYPNSTQVPNIIIDGMGIFSNTELRILLLVTRKTIGWHKETDYIAYSQFEKITGVKSNKTISVAVNSLVDRGFIRRVDKDGNSLDPMPRGFRGKTFYTLSKAVKLGTGVKITPVKNRSKNYISTGVKITPNKTNSYKTNNTEKATPSVVDNNVDNLGKRGLSAIGNIIKSKVFKKEESRVHTAFQEHALRTAEKLKIKPDASWFALFKRAHSKGQLARLERAYSRTQDAGAKDTKKYFYWAFAH